MKRAGFIPDRNDIIWLDFEPTVANEIGKYRPALVLSNKNYNKTGFLICCPVSTSIRGTELEVEVDDLDNPSVVVTNIVQTLKWTARKPKFITRVDEKTQHKVLQRLIPFLTGKQYQ